MKLHGMSDILLKKEFLVPLLIFIALLILPLVVTHDYILHVLIMIFIYAYIVECWGIIGSYTGQLSFAHGAFFGIGAYVSTLLFLNYNLTPWLGLFLGGAAAALLSFIIGFPSFKLKLRHLFFVMSTMAINEVVRVAFKQTEFLGSSKGLWLTNLRNAPLFFQFGSKTGYYYTALGLLVVGTIAVYLIVEKTYLKFYLLSIHEDEDAAESLGINVLKYKLIAFALSAFLTAFAGTFFAQYYLYIHPDTTIRLAFAEQIVLYGIVGGGGLIGPLASSMALVPISELTRYLLPSSFVGLHLIGFGVILYFVVIYKPGGIGETVEKAYRQILSWIGREK